MNEGSPDEEELAAPVLLLPLLPLLDAAALDELCADEGDAPVDDENEADSPPVEDVLDGAEELDQSSPVDDQPSPPLLDVSFRAVLLPINSPPVLLLLLPKSEMSPVLFPSTPPVLLLLLSSCAATHSDRDPLASPRCRVCDPPVCCCCAGLGCRSSAMPMIAATSSHWARAEGEADRRDCADCDGDCGRRIVLSKCECARVPVCLCRCCVGCATGRMGQQTEAAVTE